jgi:tetratricopeptide (TPR) repeat protein
MAAESVPPTRQAEASGPRSVAATEISGVVVTGDRAQVDARAPVLPSGGIPRPADVLIAAGMNNLPRPPAAVFVGRVDALALLEEGLSGVGSVVVTQAVFGLGGVGKSELALQYAHAHRGSYSLTWWITAEDVGHVDAGLSGLAERICPELALAATTAEAAAWALTWLQAHDGWLLILDDVSKPGDVESLLGQLRGGRILLTTRRDTGWQRMAAPIRLDVLAPGPAAALITTSTGSADPGDVQVAAEIAAELGFLPLALDQAAAYITQARIPLARYLELLRRYPARMYAAGPAGGQAQRTIARLWDITLQAIDRTDPVAARLLRVLACYAPDSIPRQIIGGDDAGPVEDEALALLASYSMITLTPETVSMHKLVQAVLLAAPDDTGTAPLPRDIALKWLNNSLPVNPDTNVAAWIFLRALIPHADAVASHFAAREEPATLERVFNQIALFHQSQGAYQEGLRLRNASLDIAQRIYGDGHRQTAISLGNLAVTYSALGRRAEALPLEERALDITEAALGPDHPDTALRLGNLAGTYSDLGRYVEALPLEERALAVTEAALGPDHPDTALRLGNLAGTYSDLGRYVEALPLEQRALAVTEAALGPDHPDTALRLNNLAATYSDLGRYAEALPLKERALAVTEAALGPDHPSTARCLGNLAGTYSDLGRYAEALPLEERALAVAEGALGPDHPHTALCLNNLAVTYSDLGRRAEALPLEERALAVTEAALGPDHPDTARCLNNLAVTYSALGRYAEALPLEERALAVTEAALGPDHPDMALRLGNLARTYSDLGRYVDALPLKERALAVTEAALGSDHPDTVLRLDDLAATYRDVGRTADAEALEWRAHPDGL